MGAGTGPAADASGPVRGLHIFTGCDWTHCIPPLSCIYIYIYMLWTRYMADDVATQKYERKLNTCMTELSTIERDSRLVGSIFKVNGRMSVRRQGGV